MPNLLAIIGKAKPKEGMGESSMPSDGGDSDSAERAYAREAFSASQEGDEEGFINAFVSAVKACVKKASGGGYEAEE